MSSTTIEAPRSSGFPGWMKAAIASVLSAACAAAATYASPLLDTVIKPARPVANFQAQPNGLNVTFQNKTTGGLEGWWDFGDGSALEPFMPDQLAINHLYAKPGNYTVKLTVKNLLHDENERTVALTVGAVDVAAPSIEVFRVEAVNGYYAPASFHISARAAGADMCVWALGDKPLAFTKENSRGNYAKTVTFDQPGKYVLKLAAFNGKQTAEKSEVVEVKSAPAGMVTATVAVAYEAVLVEQKVVNTFASMSFPPEQKGSKAVVPRSIAADPGFEIIKADLAEPMKDPNIKMTGLQIDPVKHDRVTVTCELSRPARAQAPSYPVALTLTEQRQSAPQVKTSEPLSVNLQVPGTTVVPLPPLPPGWVAKSKQMSLSLQHNGKQMNWNSANMPKNAPVQLASGVYVVTATEQAGALLIDVKQAK